MKPVLAIFAFLLLPALHYLLVRQGLTMAAHSVIGFAATAQTIAYGVVLAVFAGSLRAGHVPLISRFAHLTRGDLSPELVIYTRRVTIIWCLFCLAQMAAPLLLWALAPRFVLVETALNLPLVAGLVAAEYGYRLIRYRHISHESPADMVRLVRQIRGMIRPR